jgi:hypothetical protein
MLEAAGCSTRNGQQTLEVLLRTLAILELHKRELRTQDKTYIDNPHRCVALRRDGDEFVITFQPEDSIAFRSHDAKHCARFAPSCDGRS